MNIYVEGKLLNPYERVKYRKITDDEIKPLFIRIKLNTEHALPEKLVQELINDGSIEPKFIHCRNFNSHHFDRIIFHIKKGQVKNIKKIPPKPSSKKYKKIRKNKTNRKKIKKDKDDKKDKKIKIINRIKKIKRN
jgi:hypothetical protein